MNVLLVDDHPLFLEGMSNLLAAHQYNVVGKAKNGNEALILARKLKPDLILMDIEMNDIDGLAATRLIKNQLPEIKIVILTISTDDELLFDAIRSGANGYLLKNLEADQFLLLLSKLAEGEPPLAPGMTEKLMKELAESNISNEKSMAEVNDKIDEDNIRYNEDLATEAFEEGNKNKLINLTKRQEEILTLLVRGKAYREIGVILTISEVTVKYHMKKIKNKFDLKNKAEVIAFAQKLGLGVNSRKFF